MTFLMLFIAIIGIIVTYYFGAKALKSSRRMRLAYYEEDYIPLFESIVQSIEGLEVNFEKKPVSPNLVLMKGCVANVGGVDIDKSSIHKPLAFSLPEDFRWLKANILSSSSEVNASYNVSKPNELVFDWELLKPNEYFRFDALVETPMTQGNNNRRMVPGEALRTNLNLTHRITNLASVETGTLRRKQRPSISDIAALIGGVLIGISCCLIIIFLRDFNYVQTLKLNNGQTLKVEVKQIDKDKYVINQMDGSFRDTLNQNQLKTKYQIKYMRMSSLVETLNYIAIFLGGCLLVVSLFGIWKFVHEAKNERKRLKMVELLK